MKSLRAHASVIHVTLRNQSFRAVGGHLKKEILMLARAGAMAGAEALPTASRTSDSTASTTSIAGVNPILVGTEELTSNYFRLCIELSSPHHYSRLVGSARSRSCYLTLPGDFFLPLSQASFGITESYQDFCFNWRLARDPRLLLTDDITADIAGLPDSHQIDLPSTTYFGSGPIEIVDMMDKCILKTSLEGLPRLSSVFL